MDRVWSPGGPRVVPVWSPCGARVACVPRGPRSPRGRRGRANHSVKIHVQNKSYAERDLPKTYVFLLFAPIVETYVLGRSLSA